MRGWSRRAALRAVSVATLALALGCVTVESISVSQVPEKAQRRARVHGEGWSPVILLIPFGSGYADEARAALLAKCPHGAIEGVLARYERHSYFLFGTQFAAFDGYCVEDRGGHDARSRRKKG
jgi:hypothetical protein